jgi:threonine aldolase
VEYTRKVGDLAHSHGLRLHLDGARIFNAAVALNVPVSDLAGPADSVTFCLSKALCAPVGSVICGSTEFIGRALRMRKQLGGGMRQAGVLAAAGIVALEQMVDRLADDHRRARQLAAGLAQIPGLQLNIAVPPSNMVFVSLNEKAPFSAAEVVARLYEHKVRVGAVGPRGFRLVTHYWIDDEGVDRALKAFAQVL